MSDSWDEEDRGIVSKSKKNRIKLYIGLYCHKIKHFYFHDYILNHFGLYKDDVDIFQYRDKGWRGWKGDFFIRTKEGKKYYLDFMKYYFIGQPYYNNWRCHLCFDRLNEFSDISCGDCNIPKHYGKENLKQILFKSLGMSDVIIRTSYGRKV
ncbi:Coenzyme F420 hydrogenase/dehydrogenase, beta subunit C-terminal domain, partial [Candidatus Margulisiibacteriota bacterium]